MYDLSDMITPTLFGIGYTVGRNENYFKGNIAYVKATQLSGTPLHCWDAIAGSGTTLEDSVSSNDGTISGATWDTDEVQIPINNLDIIDWRLINENRYWYIPTQQLNIKVNVNGTWKDIISTKVNVGGEWKDVMSAKVNVNGTWKNL
jgi:hypothetical protein